MPEKRLERARRSYCEHEWKTESWAYNFLVCAKCGAWTHDKEDIFYPPKEKV